MEAFDKHTGAEAFARLQELITIGRRYDLFAQENPSLAAAQIMELNAPGLQESAWDLRWIPDILRAKIARVSSIIVLELCRPPENPEHDPGLMDVIMPTAIAAACVVAHAYGVAPEIPPRPLPGRLDVLASLLHWITSEQPAMPEPMARLRVDAHSVLKPPIVACLPSRIRDHLIGLAHAMAPLTDPVPLTIVTVIFTIGAVATETFEPLNFSESIRGRD